MDMSKLLTVLPLLVAVGAAIIVAQVFAPLLGGVFGLKATAVAGFLAPLGTLKVGILNTLLAPTGLTLCNIGPPLAQASGREAASGFDFDQDKIDMVANMMYNAIKSKSLAMMTRLLKQLPDSIYKKHFISFHPELSLISPFFQTTQNKLVRAVKPSPISLDPPG